MNSLRIVVGEDSALMREGIVKILEAAGIEVVGATGEADTVLSMVAALKPDVVVLDVRLPPAFSDEGINLAIGIRSQRPEVGVLVLSQFLETAWAIRLLEGGVNGIGYLLKDRVADGGELAAALQRVADGGSVIDPLVVERLVAKRKLDNPLEQLTPREMDVLKLMAEGRSNTAIGDELFLGVKTVETHVSSIMLKLGIPYTSSDNRRVLTVLAFLRDS